jgi:hypothetical protein
MQFSPLPCYLVPLRSKYSSQHPVVKHSTRLATFLSPLMPLHMSLIFFFLVFLSKLLNLSWKYSRFMLLTCLIVYYLDYLHYPPFFSFCFFQPIPFQSISPNLIRLLSPCFLFLRSSFFKIMLQHYLKTWKICIYEHPALVSFNMYMHSMINSLANIYYRNQKSILWRQL